MVSYAQSLKVGNPFNSDTDIGPIQNAMQFTKVKSFLDDCKGQGYRFVAGGEQTGCTKGYFIQPTIIDDPPENSKIVTEEPFGPIIPYVLP